MKRTIRFQRVRCCSGQNAVICLLFIFLLGTFFIASSVYATLTCTVGTSCSDTTVMKMSGTSNAHAGLPGSSSFTQFVCCNGVTGLGTNCSGSYAAALKLSGDNNAHVAETTETEWPYRMAITIDHTQVSGSQTLQNFTVLVSTTKTVLKDVAHSGHVAQSDGGDILFTNAGGLEQLSHEIDTYDPATGALVAWVKIPELSTTVDTVIYMYYGNTKGSLNMQNISSTWDDNYVSVYHFKEGSGATVSDSKSGHTATLQQTTQWTTSGQVGSAYAFDGTATSYAVIPYHADFHIGTYSVTAWTKPNTTATWGNIFSIGLSTEMSCQFASGSASTNLAHDFGNAGGWHALEAAGVLTNGTFNYYAAAMDDAADRQELFKNGSSVNANAAQTASPASYAAGQNSSIGAAADGANRFTGTIDELRFSKIARSTAWQTTEYNNQNAPATFMNIADETTPPSGVSWYAYYGSTVCLSASSGSFSIGYASNCSGYDTTFASISGATNAHVGNASAYSTKVCASYAGSTLALTASSSNSFNNPLATGFSSQTSTMSSLGALKIVGSSAGWTLALAGQDWAKLNEGGAGEHPHQLDYDGTGSDNNLGKMCPKPSNGTLYAESGSLTGVTRGSNQCYSAGVTSINVATATAGNGNGTYWLTDMPVEQYFPSNPTVQSYTTTVIFTLSSLFDHLFGWS